MCGIAGVFSYAMLDGRINLSALIAARDQMVRRGPDAAGKWISADQKVGLAHRRLAIIDLSDSGIQPMTSADGRYTIVFNGEIYNYQELRRFVLGRGYQLCSTSDTEVLPCLYDLEGVDMFRRLRGMFAFGLWDSRDRELLLARDPLGIKPLYYADDGQQIWFASQVKALLAAGISPESDAAGQVGFHLWGNVPEPFTLYRNIQALGAGCFLRVRQCNVPEVRQFWSLSGALEKLDASGSTPKGDVAEAQASLRHLMKQTVEHHMVADVPVGVFLSAGRDSSTLVALASEGQHNSLHTFTLGFDEYRNTPFDEAEPARSVARQYGTSHREIFYSPAERQRLAVSFLDAMDQPTIDGFNTFLVSNAAHESGMKVALSGVGADELFRGYDLFHTIPLLRRLARPLSWIPWLGTAFRVVSSSFLRRSVSPKYASLLELGKSLGGAYLLRRGMFLPSELPSIIDWEIVKEGLRRLRPLIQLNAVGANGKLDTQTRIMQLEIQTYLRNQLLRDTDWASMFSSLEVRTPFVDVALLEGVISHATRFGWPTKEMVAGTPRQKLPERIITRPKTGFVVPRLPSYDQRRSDEPVQRSWAREVYLTYVLQGQPC